MPMFANFLSLKGEFEAEGLTREEVAVEALYARRNAVAYLIKIGGCEAKSDVDYLLRLGVDGVVAPMIESPFAMEKYMGILPAQGFASVGVTIETSDAVDRVEAILEAGTRLTSVTIGRSDLTASFRGDGVDAPATIALVKRVAAAAHRRGLEVTMGGGISAQTRRLLRDDAELAGAIAAVETRKVVIAVDRFLTDGVLEAAIDVELELLALHGAPLAAAAARSQGRITQLRTRL